MARPKPTVLLRHRDRQTHKTEEVLEAEAIYAVFYQSKPISIRLVNTLNYPGPKYKKMSFPNSGHAFRLAEKLNETYECSDFSVVKLISGEVIRG